MQLWWTRSSIMSHLQDEEKTRSGWNLVGVWNAEYKECQCVRQVMSSKIYREFDLLLPCLVYWVFNRGNIIIHMNLLWRESSLLPLLIQMLTFIPITYTPYTQKHTVLPALRVNSAQSKRHAKLDTTETKTEQRHINISPAPGKLQKNWI